MAVSRAGEGPLDHVSPVERAAPRSRTRALRAVVLGLAIALLIAVGWRGGVSREIAPPEGSAIAASGVATAGFLGVPGIVLLYSHPVSVREDIRLLSVEPISVDPGLELLGARIGFLGANPNGMGVNGPPLDASLTWPPEGFGPTVGLPASIEHGTDIIPIFYVRVTQTGILEARGYRFTYLGKGGRMAQQTFPQLTGLKVESVDELPPDRLREAQSRESLWFSVWPRDGG